MLQGIDHVAIAVTDIDATLAMYKKNFGVEPEHRETIDAYNVEVATLHVGGSCVELVQGLANDSPISKFVAKRGEGIHHIAFAVEDIHAALDDMRNRGVDLIDDEPRVGKSNSLVAFLHPGSTGRVLYELVQNRDEE